MRLCNIETPALILDLDLFEENMRTIKAMADEARISLRPHYKSHKCTAISHMQIAGGAKGITCSKLGEAEDLVFSGVEDLLIANQIVEPAKLARVAYLASCCRLTICVDNAAHIRSLEKAAALQGAGIHCLVEYEVGMRRCGVATPEEVLALVREIERSPHLVFEGIQAYAGQLSHETDSGRRRRCSEETEARLRALCAYLAERGVAVKEVSGTSTGTVEFRERGSVYTEIQAGSYVFMDRAYRALGLPFHNALFVLATVVSNNENGIIVDVGRKSISIDQEMPVFRDYPDRPLQVSEEHTRMEYKAPGLSLGSKLPLIVCIMGLKPSPSGEAFVVKTTQVKSAKNRHPNKPKAKWIVFSDSSNRGRRLPTKFFKLAQIGIHFLLSIKLRIVISA